MLAALLLPLAALGAKEGYKITFQANGNQDTMMLLCYYHANARYVTDTAYNNGKGRYVFEDKKKVLKPGLYYISNSRDRQLDLVIYNNETRFTLTVDNQNWGRTAEAKGSKENELFYSFNHMSDVLYQEMEEAQAELDSATFYGEYVPTKTKQIDSMRMAFIEQHPKAMISRMMLATKDVAIPTHHADGTKMDMRERHEWLLSHYFDNVPLDDDFIIRTPQSVFYDRVMEYVDVYMNKMPPSMICPRLDTLIDRAEPAPEVFRWLVHTMTEKFLQSKIMVYDEVYVHLVKRYYETGKAFWMSPSGIDKEVERATKWERLLVGKVSPELILFDTLRRAHSLHHMPGQYTLLLFWSPTCGHCRDIIPAVYKVYEQYADTLQMSAFSILSEPDEHTTDKWKKFLTEHGIDHPQWVNLGGGEANVDWREVYDVQTTPQIYLIENKGNTIIAKKLGAEILEMMCEDLMRKQKYLNADVFKP